MDYSDDKFISEFDAFAAYTVFATVASALRVLVPSDQLEILHAKLSKIDHTVWQKREAYLKDERHVELKENFQDSCAEYWKAFLNDLARERHH